MKWQEEEERGGDGSGGEGFGNPRIWPLSISTEYLTEYVHRSRISLPRYILLRRPPSVSGGGSPPMRWMNRPSNRLSGASLGFSRDGIDKRAVALIKRRCKTRPRLSPPFPASEPCLLSPPSYSLRHFFSGAHLERLPSPSPPPRRFFAVCVSLSREIRVATTFLVPPPVFFAPSLAAFLLHRSQLHPVGLDSAMELQKRMPAAATAGSDGYDVLAIDRRARRTSVNSQECTGQAGKARASSRH